MKIFKNRSGFTLLELLVVISIIGILIAIGSAAFSTAQKKGRDARRRADIKALQDGFEQFYSENDGSYEAFTGSDCGSAMNDSEYFPAGTPADPKPGTYSYSCTGDVSSYCICANLEGDSGNSGAGCSFSDVTHYCLTNLQ